MRQKLLNIEANAKSELSATNEKQALLNLKAKFLGKDGQITDVLKGLKDLSVEDKKTIGAFANQLKSSLEQSFNQKLEQLEHDEINAKLAMEAQDLSLSNQVRELGVYGGGLHPVAQVQREIEDIFLSMGFEILDGPSR